MKEPLDDKEFIRRSKLAPTNASAALRCNMNLGDWIVRAKGLGIYTYFKTQLPSAEPRTIQQCWKEKTDDYREYERAVIEYVCLKLEAEFHEYSNIVSYSIIADCANFRKDPYITKGYDQNVKVEDCAEQMIPGIREYCQLLVNKSVK